MQDSESSVIYRQRQYWKAGWHSWYESCPIVKHTPKTIVVLSQDFPDAPLNPGGKFVLNRVKLLKDGMVCHSRYQENFWLEKPELGALFPSKDVIEAPCPVLSEAKALGWNTDLLPVDQLEIVCLALSNRLTIAQVQKKLASGELQANFQNLNKI